MNYLDFFGKIIIPLLSASIAGAAFFFAFRLEGQKLRAQRSDQLERKASTIVVRAVYCEGLVKLVLYGGGDNKQKARLEDLKNKSIALMDELMETPEIALAIDSELSGDDRSKSFTLLAECRAACASLDPDQMIENKKETLLLLYFTLMMLIYLFYNEKAKRESVYEAMEIISSERKELFGPLLVRKRDRALVFNLGRPASQNTPPRHGF